MVDGNTPKIVRKHDCRGHRFKTVELLSAVLNKQGKWNVKVFCCWKNQVICIFGVSSKDKPGTKGIVL